MPILGEEDARRMIRQCIAAGGRPVPVTHFAGVDWAKQGIVLIRCYGAAKKVKGGRFKIGIDKAREIAAAPKGAKMKKLLELLAGPEIRRPIRRM